MEKIKALFLDRDGVINKDIGYISRLSDFEFCDGIFEALLGFMRLGFSIFVVTNQSGIGRGLYSLDDFLKINEFMLKKLEEKGILIKKVYFCPHHPDDNCPCRKPKPGMIISALKDFNIDPKTSILIGDKTSDTSAAASAGLARSYLIGQGDLKTVFDVYQIEKGRI